MWETYAVKQIVETRVVAQYCEHGPPLDVEHGVCMAETGLLKPFKRLVFLA
jgi:hypothetical protein